MMQGLALHHVLRHKNRIGVLRCINHLYSEHHVPLDLNLAFMIQIAIMLMEPSSRTYVSPPVPSPRPLPSSGSVPNVYYYCCT